MHVLSSSARTATKRRKRRWGWNHLLTITMAGSFVFGVLSCYWQFQRYYGDENVTIAKHSRAASNCQGKEKFVQVLERAGLSLVAQAKKNNNNPCQQLPTEDQVAELYGREPIVQGLEVCEPFRAHLSENAATPQPMVRVTGLFNTGTNALDMALHLNVIQDDDDGNNSTAASDPNEMERLYQVPWFKHFPIEARNEWSKRQSGDTVRRILTIVLVRDPYRWMQSMVCFCVVDVNRVGTRMDSHRLFILASCFSQCKASYTVTWKRGMLSLKYIWNELCVSHGF